MGLELNTLEQLLGERFEPPEAECAELEDVALALAGLADTSGRARAEAHLQACADCAAALELLGGLPEPGSADAADAPPSRPDQAGAPEDGASAPAARPPAWHRRPASLALAAAASALLVVAAGLLLSPNGPDLHTAPGAGLVPKGAGDQLALAVQRGAERFTARPGDRLLEGDRIGLFYWAAQDGYLAVLHLDEQGRTTLLSPAGGDGSAAIAAGSEGRLPDGGVVEGGAGCEWLIAVFSDAPLPLEAMLGPIRAAPNKGPLCRPFRLAIPDARSVRVFPVAR